MAGSYPGCRQPDNDEDPNMKSATFKTLSAIFATGAVALSLGLASAAKAESTSQVSICHWHKQQAMKIGTDAAWQRYYNCLRGWE